ncbi:MAG: Maf-like protein, partial [Hyphomicrobiales bacterium]
MLRPSIELVKAHMISLKDAVPFARGKGGKSSGDAAAEPSASDGKKAASGRPRLVLASGSPRRLALLQKVGLEPDALRPSSVDETPRRGEVPRTLVRRLAKAKAEAAQKLVAAEPELAGSFILAADTTVAVGRRIVSKAELVDEAAAALRLLSGRAHRVHTAICLVLPNGASRMKVVETRVRFKRLSRDEIDSYLGSGEWRGKAGGYAIQGIAGCFVRKLVGSYTNVVGLPLTETVSMLQSAGFPVYFNWLT